MRNLFALLFLLTVTSFKASAAPLCTRIFLPPPSAQQISALFDDLARLTLDTDLEKIAGIKDSPLQMDLKTKREEIKQILDISHSTLAKEIQPRLAKLQNEEKNLRAVEVRARAEVKPRKSWHPEFELEHTAIKPSLTSFVGISDSIQGRRRFLFTQLGDNKSSDLIAFDPVTGKTETVATGLLVAGIDSIRNQVVTFSGDSSAGQPHAELSFYSLTNLQASLPPVTLSWDPSIVQSATRHRPHSIKFSTNGDNFLIVSISGVYSSRLQKPDEVTVNQQLTAIEDIQYFDNSSEFLSSHSNHVALNRSVAQPRHLNLPTRGQMLRLIPVDESLTVAISTTDIIYIRNWKTETIQPHKMTKIVSFKDGEHTYLVGIENGNVVLKDLNNYSDSSLFDFSAIPKDAVVKSVYVSRDGRGLVVEGTLKNQTLLWFFEGNGSVL